jgi:hypothetical protein
MSKKENILLKLCNQIARCPVAGCRMSTHITAA